MIRMDKLIILSLLGIVLMVGAAITPPTRCGAPPEISVFPNFEEFSEELEKLNISEPLHIPSERLVFVCRIENDWALNRTVDALNGFPHSWIELEDGYGHTYVLVPNGTSLLEVLPDSCIPVGKATLKSETLNRKELESSLRAYIELYEVISDTSDREFIGTRILDMKSLLSSEEEGTSNATWAEVIILYSCKRNSNVPIMAILWLGVVLTGIAGVVVIWKERRP